MEMSDTDITKPKVSAWLGTRIKWKYPLLFSCNLHLPNVICHDCFRIFIFNTWHFLPFYEIYAIMSTKSVSAKLNLHISGAFSPPVSDWLTSPAVTPPYPSTSPSFKCPKRIPSSHFIPLLHPSRVLKFISLSISPPWSAHFPPSI